MKTLLAVSCILLVSFSNAISQGWNPLGDGLNNEVLAIATHNGDVYAGGLFTDAGGDPDADYLARWDGTKWQAVAPGLNYIVWTIAFYGDAVLVGGAFTDAGGNPDADHIAYWNGKQWNALGSGLNDVVYTITVSGEEIYVGGLFRESSANGPLFNIARWDGGQWYPIGQGLETEVYAIALDEEFVYAGGGSWFEGGLINGEYIVRWDGTEWRKLGPGLEGVVTDIEIHDGRVYAGGLFPGFVANWKGGGWNYYDGGPPLTWGEVLEIDVVGDNIFAAAFDDGLYRWDGTQWQWIIPITEPVPDKAWTITYDGENLYAGGQFFLDAPGTNNIAKYAGTISTSTDNNLTTSPIIINVNPNPTTNILHYTSSHVETTLDLVTLTDLNGNIVLRKQTNDRQVDITGLAQGVYFMQVKNENTWGMAKVIKL